MLERRSARETQFWIGIRTNPFNLYQSRSIDDFIQALLPLREATQRRRDARNHVIGHLGCSFRGEVLALRRNVAFESDRMLTDI
jgi:hypothetical protein